MVEQEKATGGNQANSNSNSVLSSENTTSTSMDISVCVQSVIEEGLLPKIRKPYTITKQRERWTEEEHDKFLQALKLHGRAWRKIEGKYTYIKQLIPSTPSHTSLFVGVVLDF